MNFARRVRRSAAPLRLMGDDVQRLVAARKLALVVDLDHTLLHCCGDERQDRSIAKQLVSARPDVHRISLSKQGPTRPASDYWIKLRPGLFEFLDACQVCRRRMVAYSVCWCLPVLLSTTSPRAYCPTTTPPSTSSSLRFTRMARGSMHGR